MSSAEFTAWLAMYELEPWGEEVANLYAANVAHTVAVGSGRYRNSVKLADFLVRFKDDEPKTANEIRHALFGWALNRTGTRIRDPVTGELRPAATRDMQLVIPHGD